MVLITGINKLSSISPLNNERTKTIHSGLSFRGDSFEPQIKSIFGNMSQDELQNIKKTINENQEISSGFTSNVLKHNNIIIKSPKKTDEQSLYQNVREYFALKEIEKISPDIAVRPRGIAEYKGIFYLVEDLIKGSHPQNGKIENSHLQNLLTQFIQLDKNGIVNCDIQSGNIFLLDNGKTKLIDFGSYMFLDNFGTVMGSDYVPSSYFQKNAELLNITNNPIKSRFIKTFTSEPFADIKNLSDNPYLNIASNTSNFEIRTLYKYLLSSSENNPLEFFKNYIKFKGKIYHSQLEDFLKSLNTDILSLDKNVQNKLNKAINYETIIKQVFENPCDDVLKTELAKIQLRTFLNSDNLGSKISNDKKLQSAYNQLISLLKRNVEKSEGILKEYFSENLKKIRFQFEKMNFSNSQVEIPEDENLILKLFKKITPENTIRNDTDNCTNTLKHDNKKLYILSSIGLALLGVYYLYQNKKQSKVNQNEIKNINPFVLNTKNNNLPYIFSNFKQS